MAASGAKASSEARWGAQRTTEPPSCDARTDWVLTPVQLASVHSVGGLLLKNILTNWYWHAI
jgi:hypothetical protein